MNVRIMTRHPIATSAGVIPWDDKVYTVDPEIYQAGGERLGKWLNNAMGRLGGFNFRPGYSRQIDGVWHYFPRRRGTGVHVAWVVEV